MDKVILHTLLRSFLDEDIGHGDLTSEPLFTPDVMGSAELVARESFVVAGAESVVAEVFHLQNPEISCT